MTVNPAALVDSNVLLDVFENDPVWYAWSEMTLGRYGKMHRLYINPIIYTEVSVGFSQIETLEQVL